MRLQNCVHHFLGQIRRYQLNSLGHLSVGQLARRNEPFSVEGADAERVTKRIFRACPSAKRRGHTVIHAIIGVSDRRERTEEMFQRLIFRLQFLVREALSHPNLNLMMDYMLGQLARGRNLFKSYRLFSDSKSSTETSFMF